MSTLGTCNLKLEKLEKAAGDFGGLSRVHKAAFRCINTYTYFGKRPNTHRDMPPSPPGTCNLNPKMLENAVGDFCGLSCVNKTLLAHISVHLYFGK